LLFVDGNYIVYGFFWMIEPQRAQRAQRKTRERWN